jgi:hypothetical protein
MTQPKYFLSPVNKGKFGMQDGIMADLTRECGGQVQDDKVVEVVLRFNGTAQKMNDDSKTVAELENGFS